MNRFGDEGGQQVASALQKNTTLTNVDISRNALGGASAITFSFFLRRNNQTLKKLVLSDNSLGPIGGKALMRAVAFGATCEIVGLSVHDVEAPIADKGIFDAMLPSLSSPFTLDLQNSPYHYVVACELLEAALVHKRCKLTDVRFLDTTKRGNTKPLSLLVDEDKWQLVDSIKKEVWILPPYGIFYANALYIPSPLGKIIKRAHKITKENFISLANIIKKGISSREICTLM
jgi:hypothetical protein